MCNAQVDNCKGIYYLQLSDKESYVIRERKVWQWVENKVFKSLGKIVWYLYFILKCYMKFIIKNSSSQSIYFLILENFL